MEDAHLLLNRQHVQALSAMEPEFMAVRFPVMQNNPHLLHTALERLYGDHRIGAVLDRHFPNLREMPNYSQAEAVDVGADALVYSTADVTGEDAGGRPRIGRDRPYRPLTSRAEMAGSQLVSTLLA
ncbi:MAG: hypothetical protein HND48_02415 [Chloroflexi bacterium]|nr:hypothetical protein [Chloroflexota bacterium]